MGNILGKKNIWNKVCSCFIPALKDDFLYNRYSQRDSKGVPLFQTLSDKDCIKIMRRITSDKKLTRLMNQASFKDGITNFMYLNDEGQLYVSMRLKQNNNYFSLFKKTDNKGYSALCRISPSLQRMFVRRLPDFEILPFFHNMEGPRKYNEFLYLDNDTQKLILYRIKDSHLLKSFLLMPATSEGETIFRFLSEDLKIRSILRMRAVEDVYDLYKKSVEHTLNDIIDIPLEYRRLILKKFPELDKQYKVVCKKNAKIQLSMLEHQYS